MNSAQRSIRLSGVDLVDGTPVLDVKPYVPDYDCPRTTDTHGSGGTGGESGVRVAVRFRSPSSFWFMPVVCPELEEPCVVATGRSQFAAAVWALFFVV